MTQSVATLILFILLTAVPVHADDTDVTPPGGPAAVDETHPVYSADARWVPTILVAIGGLFLAALIVGRVVRSEAMEVPPSLSDEKNSPADPPGHLPPG